MGSQKHVLVVRFVSGCGMKEDKLSKRSGKGGEKTRNRQARWIMRKGLGGSAMMEWCE